MTQHTGSRFPVLVFQGLLQVFDRESEVGQSVGLNPYLHGVVATADIRHATYALDTSQHIYYVECRVVTQINLVEFRVVRQQRNGHQLARSLLLYRDAVLYHLGRQTGFGLLDPVLYFYGRQVGVGRYVEGDGCRKTTRVAVGRLHVEHTGGTVQLLLDRCGYGLGNGLGTRSRIGGRDLDYRGNNLGILVYGEEDKAQYTHNYDHD